MRDALIDVQTRKAHLPLAGREIAIRAVQSSDATGQAATARLVFAAGAAVQRYDWFRERAYVEQLTVEPGAMRLDRLQRGVPLLNTHSAFDLSAVLGVCDNPTVSGGLAECDATFSRRDDVAGYVQDVQDGVIRNVSVGYVRHRIEMEPPAQEGGPWVYRVTDWEPMEVSLVPIPADMDAQVRGQADPSSATAAERLRRTYPCEFIETRTTVPSQQETAMPTVPSQQQMAMLTTQVQPIETRAEVTAEVRHRVKRHGLPESFGADLEARGLSLEACNSAIIDELARRDIAAGCHNTARQGASYYSGTELLVSRTQDLMLEALSCRLRRSAVPAGNPFQHARVVDMAREILELRGIRTADLSPGKMIERGLHATSDFPGLLSGAGERNLRRSYESYQGGLKRAFRPSTARDFRPKEQLQLSEAPMLLKVNEHAEFTSGTMAEAKTSYALATYGRIFGLTRQALVNDDLEAFATMTQKLGIAAAEFEAKFLVTLLTSGPVMSDGLALFHANHGNLQTGGASALQFSSLSNARQAMRLQKGQDGSTPIDATPKFLIVPAALETTGQQLLTTIAANETTKVNPFGGSMELIVDPRLDAISASAWYLAADPGLIDTIEYSYLDSANGPEVMTQEGFEVDGIQMKVRLDFGAGALDWRGLYRSAGV